MWFWPTLYITHLQCAMGQEQCKAAAGSGTQTRLGAVEKIEVMRDGQMH